MKKLIVILAVVAMVGAFTATAMADVDLYGSARFRTYYKSDDSGVAGVDSDDDLEWRMGHLTRFGAVITSYSIHYTKLYDAARLRSPGSSPTPPPRPWRSAPVPRTAAARAAGRLPRSVVVKEPSA